MPKHNAQPPGFRVRKMPAELLYICHKTRQLWAAVPTRIH